MRSTNFSALLLVLLFLSACGTVSTPVLPESTPAVIEQEPVIVPTETAPDQATLQAPTDIPGGDVLLQERCTACHSLDRVTSAVKTAEEWKTTVERMVRKGASLDPQEQQTLINFLAETYHP